MKKLFAIVSILGLGFFPLVAAASNIEVGQEYTLRSTEVVPGNFYVAGSKVVIAGSVSDDLTLGAGDALVRGSVGGDVMAGGGTVSILGSVGGDVRTAGGTVTIGGSVSGDVLVAGGEVHIISGARVTGDVIAAGGRVIIDGPVGGSVRVAGGEVTINEKVAGDVRVRSDNVIIGSGAVISGTFQYASPSKAIIDSNAQILGETHYTELPRFEKELVQKGFKTFGVLWALFKFLTVTIGGYCLFLLFRSSLFTYIGESLDGQRFVRNVLFGVAGLVGFPIFILACFVTIIGSLLGVFGALSFAGFLIIVRIMAPIALGSLVYQKILRTPERAQAWHVVLVGNIIFVLLKAIPVIGHIVSGLIALSLAGVLVHSLTEVYSNWRHKSARAQ